MTQGHWCGGPELMIIRRAACLRFLLYHRTAILVFGYGFIHMHFNLLLYKSIHSSSYSGFSHTADPLLRCTKYGDPDASSMS